MGRRERTVCIIMSAVMAVFMAVAPGYFNRARQELSIRGTPREREPFQGIITLWHIVGFKPYQGSLGSWLGSMAEDMEGRYPGIYFEVDSITLEECGARISRGERPDIYSFPLGWAGVEQLAQLALEPPVLRGNLCEAGRHGGELYGLPFALSGYVVSCNLRLMQEQGIEEQKLSAMIRSGQVTAAGPAVAGAVYGAGAAMCAGDEYLSEEVTAAIIDARAAGDMNRRVQSGGSFVSSVMEYGNYTDLVQLLGVSRYAGEAKLPYALEFIQSVLEEEAQNSLLSLGLIPAAQGEYAPDSPPEPVVEILLKQLEEPAAPNSFLYKRYRDQLALSADAALSGDASAKKDFDLRMQELVRGAAIR